MAWSIRLRSPAGQNTLTGLSADMSVADFQQAVAGVTGIDAAAQQFRGGYPPAALTVPSDKAETIASWGLKQGDTLLVAAATNVPVVQQAAQVLDNATLAGMSEDEMLARAIAASMGQELSAPAAQAPTQPAPRAVQPVRAVSDAADSSSTMFEALPDGRHIVRRVIDSDNSCLFNAVGYNLESSRKVAPKLRRVVASTVAADPFTFNDGFLGKSNAEYQKWILDPQRWGGGIELFILSRHFQVEIAAYDIQTQRVDIYGQECGFKQRCMVVYDGLHYDALAVGSGPVNSESRDITLFDVGSPLLEQASHGAAALVARMHKSRKFTDTANFTLRCGVCLVGLKGEKEAVRHAQETGHQNFQEY